MTEIRVVGCDPGETVGLAFYTSNGEQSTFHSFEARFNIALDFLRGWLDGEAQTHIGVERYTIGRDTHKKTQQTRALEVIGAVNEIARVGSHRVTLRPPGPAKTLGNSTRLRAIGWWQRGGEGHHNDAASHCLIQLAQSFPMEFARIVNLDRVNTQTTEVEDAGSDGNGISR